jgi:Protein of unknown function (DUF2975)
VRSTFWLHFVRVVLGVMLFLDVIALLFALLDNVQTVGTVQSGDLFAGEPYLQRMHQELSTGDVFVMPTARPTTGQHVLYAVSHTMAFCLAVIPILILARRLITGVINADPFTRRTVHRLRVLGVVILAAGAASELTEYITARILLDSAVPAALRTWAHPDFHASFWWLIPGLIMLAFAEVVRRGCQLRDELDTVI